MPVPLGPSGDRVNPGPGWVGRVLVLVLVLNIGLAWFAIQGLLVLVQAVWLAAAGQVFAGAEPGRVAGELATLRLVQAAFWVGAAVLGVAWIHRTHRTLATLGAPGVRSIRDSIRACLVPGVNLVRVPSVVAGLWRASGAEAARASVSAWVGWWWALCLATLALDLAALGWLGLGGGLPLRVLAECARIAAAVLTIVVVTRVERLLRDRCAALPSAARTVAGA
jgi:hypothetical protein